MRHQDLMTCQEFIILSVGRRLRATQPVKCKKDEVDVIMSAKTQNPLTKNEARAACRIARRDMFY